LGAVPVNIEWIVGPVFGAVILSQKADRMGAAFAVTGG